MTPHRGWRRCGLLLLAALVVLGATADWVAPYDPSVPSGPPFGLPSAEHWLGTNDIGHDILSELLHATRASLTIGLLSALLAATLGTIVGMVAAYGGGWIDSALMRVVDVVLVVPLLPLVILLAAHVGTSQWQLVAVIALLMWARPARVLRAHTLAVTARDHVLAARAGGAGPWRVVAWHLLGAVLPMATTQFVLVAGNAIALEAGLSFLGLGDPTQKSWGTMLFYAQARNAFLTGHWPWWVVPPGVMIATTVLSFAFIGLSPDRRRA